MQKWYKNNQGLIWITTVVAALISYTYTTFATVTYVDKKHMDVIEVLKEIKSDVKDIREKVYDTRR